VTNSKVASLGNSCDPHSCNRRCQAQLQKCCLAI